MTSFLYLDIIVENSTRFEYLNSIFSVHKQQHPLFSGNNSRYGFLKAEVESIMNALTNPEPSIPFHVAKPRIVTFLKTDNTLHLPAKNRDRWIRRNCRLTVRAVLDSAIIDQLGIPESDIRNPAISTTYRNSKLPKPNQTVLDAQARVCTGPMQTKPLNEEQAFKVLDTVLKSGAIIVNLNLSLL